MKRLERKKSGAPSEPVIQVGKSGILSVVDELKKQLKDKELIKVKFLRTALLEGNRYEMAEKLANMTGADLVEVRGNTAIIRRKA